MHGSLTALFLQLAEIIWVDILLSGDNAVVIALACRGLPAPQRRLGILAGGAAAILLRLIFAVVIVQLLELPALKLVSGLILLWIAIKLVVDEEDHSGVTSGGTLWRAVRTIAIADAIMSLDNVLAIVAIAKENVWLIITGLLASMPLIIAGSSMLIKILHRLPILIWAGCALLGYVAAGIILSDPLLAAPSEQLFRSHLAWAEPVAGGVGALLCVGIAWMIERMGREA